MASATSTPTPRTNASGDKRQLIAMLIAGGLLLLAVLGYSTLYFGFVSGQEFCADTFNRREFSFYQIPLIGLQISPISRTNVTNSLETFLVASKFVATPATPPATQRWDLVYAHRGIVEDSRRLLSHGEARILCEYLDAEDSPGKSLWLAWTQKNTAIAKVVWPAVAKVAQQELYVFAPELLIRARDATDPVKLQRDIDSHLAERYLAFAKTQQQLQNHQVAVELFTEALNHAPAGVEALAGRAESLSSLGKSDQAAADLAQAKKLEADR